MMMRRRRLSVSLIAGLLSLLDSTRVHAYCRTSTCLPNGSVCDPPVETDCGLPVAWFRDCVGVALQRDGTAQMPFEDARTAILNGFAAWMAPVCGGASPGIATIDMGQVPCRNAEYNKTAGNVNVVVFRDQAWTHPEGANYIALTTVTFGDETGEIYDVDVEINSASFQFTAQPSSVGYDLQAVMTHEAGHFFGLAHSLDPESTMWDSYEEGSNSLRTLAADDINAICATYPPRPVDASTCNPIPRHGFAPECAADQPKHGCSATRARRGAGSWGWIAVLAVAMLAIRRRRPRGGQSARSRGDGLPPRPGAGLSEPRART
jgi:hypothetical protein